MVYISRYTYMYIYILCVFIFVFAFVFIVIYMYIYICICIYKYIYIYTYLNIYIYDPKALYLQVYKFGLKKKKRRGLVAPSPHKARWQYLFSHAILFSHVLLQVESGLKVYIMHNMHSCELIERRLRHKTVLGIGRFIRCYQSVLVNLIVGWFFRQKTIVVVYCSYLMVYSLSARWLHHTAKKPHKNKKKWKPRNQSGKQIVRFNKKNAQPKKNRRFWVSDCVFYCQQTYFSWTLWSHHLNLGTVCWQSTGNNRVLETTLDN